MDFARFATSYVTRQDGDDTEYYRMRRPIGIFWRIRRTVNCVVTMEINKIRPHSNYGPDRVEVGIPVW